MLPTPLVILNCNIYNYQVFGGRSGGRFIAFITSKCLVDNLVDDFGARFDGRFGGFITSKCLVDNLVDVLVDDLVGGGIGVLSERYGFCFYPGLGSLYVLRMNSNPLMHVFRTHSMPNSCIFSLQLHQLHTFSPGLIRCPTSYIFSPTASTAYIFARTHVMPNFIHFFSLQLHTPTAYIFPRTHVMPNSNCISMRTHHIGQFSNVCGVTRKNKNIVAHPLTKLRHTRLSSFTLDYAPPSLHTKLSSFTID